MLKDTKKTLEIPEGSKLLEGEFEKHIFSYKTQLEEFAALKHETESQFGCFHTVILCQKDISCPLESEDKKKIAIQVKALRLYVEKFSVQTKLSKIEYQESLTDEYDNMVCNYQINRKETNEGLSKLYTNIYNYLIEHAEKLFNR